MIHLYRPLEESARRVERCVVDFMIKASNKLARKKAALA